MSTLKINLNLFYRTKNNKKLQFAYIFDTKAQQTLTTYKIYHKIIKLLFINLQISDFKNKNNFGLENLFFRIDIPQ